MSKKIYFRPHHFMCTLGFQGNGYSPDFIENFQKISTILAHDDNTLIEVVESDDSICGPCPHRQNHACEFQPKIDGLDKRHKEALAINGGDILSWAEAQHKIRTLISIEKFDQICEGCGWKRFGICLAALEQLKSLV